MSTASPNSSSARLWAAALLIAAAAIAAASWAGARGSAARSAPLKERRVMMVANSTELFETLFTHGVHGRRALVISRHLHYTGIDVPERGTDRFPIEIVDVHEAYKRDISPATWLWASVHNGIFRSVNNVVPPDVLNDRRASAVPKEMTASTPDSISLHDFGTPRVISISAVPSDDLPVVVVDASAMSTLDTPWVPDGECAKSIAASDLVIFNLAGDAPDVTDHEREALRAAYGKYSGGALR